MAVNKVASVILIDTSRGMDLMTSDGRSYFERSKWILTRILLRKMFAYENDEVGIISFGPDGPNVVSTLGIPTWDTFKDADSLSLSSKTAPGNWIKALVRAVDFVENETAGKRFKDKQIVVLSNFTWSTSKPIHEELEKLGLIINSRCYRLLVIGLDIKKESQDLDGTNPGPEIFTDFVSELDKRDMCTFEDMEEDLKLYKKKQKAKRLTKSALKIGSAISVPIRWMKVTTEDTRLKFEVPDKYGPKMLRDPIRSDTTQLRKTEAPCESPVKKPKMEIDVTSTSSALDQGTVQLKFAQDESRKTRYGATEVLLSYADLEALKRKTGPASLTFLGTVKSAKITRAMIVSSDVYVIVADPASKRSQAQLSALVTALLKQNKYGLARRIPSTDGKVNIGILYPVSDELGKALYFLKLPMAEWVKTVPYRPLPDVEEPPLVDLMGQLVDKMSIDGAGRDLLVKDPNFQVRNTIAENKVRGQDPDTLPSHILELFDPYPGLLPEPILDRISKLYPIPEPPPENVDDDPTLLTSDRKDIKSVVSSQPAKQLTDEQRKEVEDIEELFRTQGNSLMIEAEMVYNEKPAVDTFDTEDVLKLL